MKSRAASKSRFCRQVYRGVFESAVDQREVLPDAGGATSDCALNLALLGLVNEVGAALA